jgi:hypothetical protein
MATASIPHEDLFDDMAALRGQLLRQARQIATLQTTVAGLTATMANVMARVYPIGTMVLDEQEPPEWLDEPADAEPPLEPQPVFLPPAGVAHGA